MPVTINAIDNEFAASSGSNVNAFSDRSIFDYPPNSTSNLTITSNMGDENPFYFDVGETYDLTWQGHGGGTMEDATIIRSDYVGPGEGAIVFEGINSNTGELYQVVWSPNFDLEQWFYDNGGASNPPGFWTNDQQTADYQYVCFTSGSRIATPTGYRFVNELRAGDMVQTQDNGAQEILWTGSRKILGTGNSAPVTISPGVLGNIGQIQVSQQHRMLIRSPQAELAFGDSEVWVPAKSLVNGTNIFIKNQREVSYFHILLANHEILNVDGAAAESLFVGDIAARSIGAHAVQEINQRLPEFSDIRNTKTARPDLSYSEGQMLAQMIGLTGSTPSQHLIAA